MRNATLDLARLAAAAGIVFFHVGAPGAWLGYAALPFFLMLTLVLAWPAARRQGFAALAAGRGRRLLGPWLGWSAAYAALKLADAVATGRPPATEFAPWMLATGPALHLWFLPFAFAACLALWPVARAAAGLGGRGRAGLAAALVAAAVAAAVLRPAGLAPPLAQWSYALPAVLLGAGLALVPEALAAAALAAVATAGLAAAGWPGGATQLALAAAALVACRALPLPDSAAARRAADLSLGVYLAHPMVAAVLLRVTPLPEASLGLALATLAGALAVALLVERAGALLAAAARHPALSRARHAGLPRQSRSTEALP